MIIHSNLSFRPTQTFEFIPEWNGNKSDPSPITFELRYLTAPEVDEAIGAEGLKRGYVVARSVVSIKNFTIVEKDGTEHKIETAKDFIMLNDSLMLEDGRPPYGLLHRELFNKILTVLPSGVDVKN
jgi:hypothetical protein